MPAKHGFQFQPSDLKLVQHAYELRLATIQNLAHLANRSYKQTAERLAKLEERKYLKLVRGRPHEFVYTIGREAVPLLIEAGYASQELAEKRLRDNELTDLGFRHALFVVKIHVRVLLEVKARGLTLVNWVEGPSLWDTVTTSANVRTPIRPDAWFTIGSPNGARAHLFLEADRGTMAYSRMREKVTGYAAYFQQQRHIKKYPGMKTFRVPTITETRARADGLAAEFRTMMPADWLRAYPVIAFEDLTLERLIPELIKTSGPAT